MRSLAQVLFHAICTKEPPPSGAGELFHEEAPWRMDSAEEFMRRFLQHVLTKGMDKTPPTIVTNA